MKIENRWGFPASRFFGGFTMLREDGAMAFLPHPCKEIATYGLGSSMHFGHQVMGYARINDGVPDLENPKWMIYTKGRHTKNNIRRVQEIIDVLSGQLMLSPPKVYEIDGIEAIVVEVDKWFNRSSVTTHMLLTFIRSAFFVGTVSTKSVMHYVEDLIREGQHRIQSGDSNSNDWRHLKSGKNTLISILRGESPVCLRYDNTDWLTPRRERLAWPGIKGYAYYADGGLENEALPLISTEKAISLCGYQNPDEMMVDPGENYVRWTGYGEF